MDSATSDQQPNPQSGEAAPAPAPDQAVPTTLPAQDQQQQQPVGVLPDQQNLTMQADFTSLQNAIFPPGGLLPPEALMHMQQLMPMPMALDANGLLPVMPGNDISADEIELYDRQIRLWGMQAQQKIRNANVLLITMKALANEIAKNLVLAGIGSLTIVDHETVTEADLGAQFFLSEQDGHLGMNRAEAALPQIQKLNPRVKVHIDKTDIRSKGPSYFGVYDVVIATDLDPDTLNVVNTATRVNGRYFYAAGTHGLYGFIFADLIEHDFVIERAKGNVTTELKPETRTRLIVGVNTKKEDGKTIEMVTKRELYSTWFLASDTAYLPDEYKKSKRRLKAVTPVLPCLRALWEFQQVNNSRTPHHTPQDLQQFTRLATQKHKDLGLPAETLRSDFLRSFLQNIGSEIAPVTAILGGQLAQDVINVLGQTQQPIQNMVIFDGNTMEATMYPLHPEGPLGAQLLSMTAPTVGVGMNGDLGMLDASMLAGMPPVDLTGMVDFSAVAAGIQPQDPAQQQQQQQPPPAA